MFGDCASTNISVTLRHKSLYKLHYSGTHLSDWISVHNLAMITKWSEYQSHLHIIVNHWIILEVTTINHVGAAKCLECQSIHAKAPKYKSVSYCLAQTAGLRVCIHTNK